MSLHACPRCDCDEPAGQPATSDPRHRAVLIDGVKRLIDSNRRQRTTVTTEEEQ